MYTSWECSLVLEDGLKCRDKAFFCIYAIICIRPGLGKLERACTRILPIGYYGSGLTVQYLKFPMHLAHCVDMLCCPVQHLYMCVTFVAC